MIKIKKIKKTFFVTSPDAPGNNNFWIEVEGNKWESDTYEIFDIFLDERHSYIDMGAWIGSTVLYGCQLAKHCYAIEPDPVALTIFKDNIKLNPGIKNKITLYDGCIWNTSGNIKIGTQDSFGDSMSSVLFSDSKEFLTVKSLTLAEFIKIYNIKNCNFIKMDIEGGETIVMPSIKDYLQKNKPTLLLSLHPQLFKDLEKNSESIINVLNIYENIYYANGITLKPKELLAELLVKRSLSIVATDHWSSWKKLLYIVRFNTATYARLRVLLKQILFLKQPKFYYFLKNVKDYFKKIL